jgi:hypothetical protein
MSPKKNTLKYSRLLHLYLGVFAAPAIIFFSITGALQTFSLHETTRGSSYQPPRIIAQLAQLHKKQTLVVPEKKPQPSAKPAADKPVGDKSAADKPANPIAPAPRAPEAPPAKTKNLLPMKFFFLVVSISLLTSTITGIYMAYKYVRNKTIVTATLAAGIIIPILLTLF